MTSFAAATQYTQEIVEELGDAPPTSLYVGRTICEDTTM